MSSTRNHVGALMTATLLVFVNTGQPASAITAELAKQCRAMAFKEHPPVRAGSKPGAAKAQQSDARGKRGFHAPHGLVDRREHARVCL